MGTLVSMVFCAPKKKEEGGRQEWRANKTVLCSTVAVQYLLLPLSWLLRYTSKPMEVLRGTAVGGWLLDAR